MKFSTLLLTALPASLALSTSEQAEFASTLKGSFTTDSGLLYTHNGCDVSIPSLGSNVIYVEQAGTFYPGGALTVYRQRLYQMTNTGVTIHRLSNQDAVKGFCDPDVQTPAITAADASPIVGCDLQVSKNDEFRFVATSVDAKSCVFNGQEPAYIDTYAVTDKLRVYALDAFKRQSDDTVINGTPLLFNRKSELQCLNTPQHPRTDKEMVRLIEGTFDNSKQANSDPNKSLINMQTCRVYAPDIGDHLIYIEQLGTFNRQRLYKFENKKHHNQAILKLHTFKDPTKMLGFCQGISTMKTVTLADIDYLTDCDMKFKQKRAVGHPERKLIGHSISRCPTTFIGDWTYTTVVLRDEDLFVSTDFMKNDGSVALKDSGTLFERRTVPGCSY